MTSDNDKNERQNVFANNVRGETLHISEAESGQNGYYCIGCTRELQAVKSKLPNRMHFFRHVAVDVKIERLCTYSDQTFRHKLAKELLARLRHIKAPAVYKYPPKGFEGLANLIKDSALIEAAAVEMERAFYEDEAGEIKWGSGQDVEDKYLLVRPDVTFFDNDGKPILFIELVATHKVNNEKKAKLKRLGIDTLEVSIPKDSAEAIEAALYSSEKIKWIYNNDEERATYIPIPNGNSTGIPQIDEQQRKLFEESFECRQAEIRNLIRTVTRVLESEQYRGAYEAIRTELSRVKGNTEEHQSRLAELQDSNRDAVIEKHAGRRGEIEKQRTRLDEAEREFKSNYKGLESRYFKKREELKSKERETDQQQYAVDGALRGDSETESGFRESNQRIKEDLELLIDREKSEIARIEQELETGPGQAQANENALIERFRSDTERANAEISRIDAEITAIPGRLETGKQTILRSFEFEEGKLPAEFSTKESDLEREFEELRKQSHQTIMSRNAAGNSDAAGRIRKLLETRQLLNDLEQIQRNLKRKRTAWNCFNEGSYKNWME